MDKYRTLQNISHSSIHAKALRIWAYVAYYDKEKSSLVCQFAYGLWFGLATYILLKIGPGEVQKLEPDFYKCLRSTKHLHVTVFQISFGIGKMFLKPAERLLKNSFVCWLALR